MQIEVLDQKPAQGKNAPIDSIPTRSVLHAWWESLHVYKYCSNPLHQRAFLTKDTQPYATSFSHTHRSDRSHTHRSGRPHTRILTTLLPSSASPPISQLRLLLSEAPQRASTTLRLHGDQKRKARGTPLPSPQQSACSSLQARAKVRTLYFGECSEPPHRVFKRNQPVPCEGFRHGRTISHPDYMVHIFQCE